VSFAQLRDNADVQHDIDRFRPDFDRPPDHRLELTLRTRNLPLVMVQSMEFEKGLYVPPVEFNDTMPMMNWLSTGAQVTWVLRDLDTGSENMEIYWDFDVGDVAKISIFNDPETLHPMGAGGIDDGASSRHVQPRRLGDALPHHRAPARGHDAVVRGVGRRSSVTRRAGPLVRTWRVPTVLHLQEVASVSI